MVVQRATERRERASPIDAAGAVELRWLLTLLGVCLAALAAGFLIGFWLGS